MSGRSAGDRDWQEQDSIVEIPGFEDGAGSGSAPQQPALARPRRHLALRIGEGVLAALLIVGLALSWLILAQKLRPSSPGSSSHPRQTPTAGPTVSPSLLGYNVSLTVVDGVAYASSSSGTIYALRVSDGSLPWRYNTAGPVGGPVASPPRVVDGVVYVSANVAQGPGYTAGYVYALRAGDGALLWRFTRGNYVSMPTVVNGVAYIGSGDDTVSALRASDGSLLWRYTTTGSVYDSPLVVDGAVYVSAYVDQGPGSVYALRATNGTLLWHYTTKGYVYTPTVVNGVAYTDTPEGLVALRASDGTLLWRYTLDSTGFSPPTVINGVVFTIALKISPAAPTGGGYLLQTTARTVPSREKTPFKSGVSSVYALRASDGAILWHYTMNNGKDSWGTLFSVAHGVVYVGANAVQGPGSVSALQASDGALLWRYTTRYSKDIDDSPISALVAKGIIYIGSDSGTIYALRTSNGSLLWRYLTIGKVFDTPILAGGSVYVGTTGGFVFALQASNGSLLWRYPMDVSG